MDLSWDWLWVLGSIFAVLGAIYTAFLFAQARGKRSYGNLNGFLLFICLVHAIISGSFVMMIISPLSKSYMANLLFISIIGALILSL